MSAFGDSSLVCDWPGHSIMPIDQNNVVDLYTPNEYKPELNLNNSSDEDISIILPNIDLSRKYGERNSVNIPYIEIEQCELAYLISYIK